MNDNNLVINEKFLPIGTVVLLDGGKRLVMILGFCSSEFGSGKIFDYSGCLYPEGVISSNEILLFNHDQIVKVYHYGFIDETEKEFKKNLKASLEE